MHRTIAIYNQLKRPEINVKLVFLSSAMLTVSFMGGFCYSCGVLGYVEDFGQQFKVLSGDKAELKVTRTREINPRTFEADYTIKHRQMLGGLTKQKRHQYYNP